MSCYYKILYSAKFSRAENSAKNYFAEKELLCIIVGHHFGTTLDVIVFCVLVGRHFGTILDAIVFRR